MTDNSHKALNLNSKCMEKWKHRIDRQTINAPQQDGIFHWLVTVFASSLYHDV